MSNKPTALLIPKLRFPKFRNKEEWANKVLAPYLVDCSGRAPSNTELPIYSSTREGLKRQDAYFDGQILQNNNEYGVVPPNCFVYRHMSDDGLFKFNINETGGDIAVSKEYPVFKTEGLNAVFLLAKLNEGFDFKKFALSQKAGGTRTRLYFSKLCEWQTLLPSITEQQKIADCLSSLDELIAAQARKVDALKTHKKGLMQQLFPREGETQPCQRFPEFRDAGEWEEQRLDELAHYENGKAHENEISANGRYIVVNSKFISTEGAVRKFSNEGFCVADIGDILMVLSDVPSGRAIAKCFFVESDDLYTVNQRICRIQPTKVNGRFLFYVLDRNSYFLDFDDGVKQTNLRKEDVVGFPLSVPAQPDEQKRIADSFTSLDNLITAAAQELETIKTHKKGLMQQLFPSVGGVAGEA
jgi:type I restriction enzyme, S subunit